MSLFSFSAGQINGQTLFYRLEWQMSVTTSEIAVDEQGKNKISSQRWPQHICSSIIATPSCGNRLDSGDTYADVLCGQQ